MKRRKFSLPLLLFSFLAFFLACNKSSHFPPPVEQEPNDIAAVKLKEIIVSSLPSPYYHFTYNNEGYVMTINYASDLFQYTLQYQNNRVKSMVNAVNQDSLVYRYTNKKITAIDTYSGMSDERIAHHDLAYDLKGHLIKLWWYVIPHPNGDSLLERVVEIQYNAAGNIDRYNNHFMDENGELSITVHYAFEDYDDNINVEDFGLLKSFFEDLIYLPSVKLQKNNPRKLRISSSENEFEITYNFTYNDKKLPVEKQTTTKQIRGSNAGRVTTSTTTYSYY
jgi:hypothetical protein